ncbi:DinB family protein [Plastoroseomonas arctica]|nr:DinB family protein [Plastoroseomonas arctica]
MFARYNAWANDRIYAATAELSPQALAEDRGAFFGSLLGTLNHLLVTDRLWMARIEGTSQSGTRLNAMLHHDFAELRVARQGQDQALVALVEGMSEERLAQPLAYATTTGVAQSQPLHEVLSHLFNHQTHHRGHAHHLVGLALGQEKAPVLDLLAYQRSIARAA